MKYAVLLGRLLFASIFLMSAFGHFSPTTIGFAAAQGVPLASLTVPLSGIMELVGGLSILLGYRGRWGAWLIVAFMVPVTLMMHQFWTISDPMAAQMDMVMFTKNLAITGGALLIAWFGTGPLSLDARSRQRESGTLGARVPA